VKAERADLLADVRLVYAVPAAAREELEGALPVVDVSGLAGARVLLRRGFAGVAEGEGVALRAGCVAGPSDRWAPGVEDLVFDRATSIARGVIAADIKELSAAPIKAEGRLLSQRFQGQGTRREAPSEVSIEGRHVLAFAGEDREAVLCTLVCIEPSGRAPRCATLVEAASLEGALMEAPPPSLLVRALIAAATHPARAGALAVVLGALVVAVILARRPRPRP
jgi:hypothetical protein